MKTKKILTASLPIIILLILIDQLSKYLIRSQGGFYICNQNLAFGLKIPAFLFWLFGIGLIIFLTIFLFKKYFIPYTLYLILILSGAISNLIDRLYFGCVIDFIDIKIWPVFNLADIYITASAIILLLISVKSRALT